MRVRAIFVGLAAVAATAALAATALAGSGTDRVTGGGQVLLGTPGAGNTIAFTAQGTPDAATGQVQFIDRSAGTGQSQERFHGIVDCLNVSGNRAQIYGHARDGGAPFTVYVMDNGEGSNASGDDVVVFSSDPQGDCQDPSDDQQGSTALARGNAQVYDAP